MSLIVVGTDGTAHAAEAVKDAARAAHRRGATLRIIHAWPEPSSVSPGLIGTPRDVNPEATEGAAERIVSEAAALAARQSPGVDVSTTVMAGDPADVLLAASETADVLVVGSRGRGDFASLFLGSVSHACVKHAHGPVVVVHEPVVAAATDVVVGVDGSPESEAALAFALHEARLRGGSLEVVQAWHTPVAVALGPMMAAAPVDPGPAREASKALVKISLESARDEGVEVSGTTVEGDPASALCHAARGAALLVVGSHRTGSLASLALGSVAHGVLRHAPCPVALVPLRPTR